MTDASYADLKEKLQATPIDKIDPSDPLIYYHHLYELLFARLRRECPVHYCQNSFFGPFWSITKYRHIVEVESNPEVFSSSGGFTIVDIPQNPTARSFMTMDPPEHRVVRQAVTPVVSLNSLKSLEHFVSGLVSDTLDQLPLDQPFDWVSRVSVEITIKALAMMMGVPGTEATKLQKWSDLATAIPQPGAKVADLQAYYQELQECKSYIERLCSEMVGRTDLFNIPSMIMNSQQSRPLSKDEIFLNILGLLAGGNDTTRHSLTGGALFFEQNPDQRAMFYANPDLLGSGVSEIIRYQTPVAHMRRTAKSDVDFHGQSIKKGDKVVLWYVSANRDEDEIETPERFIVNRKDHDHHLAFGHGPHRCIGKNIALLELKLFWAEMARRKLAVRTLGPPERVKSGFVNGYSSLMVQLESLP